MSKVVRSLLLIWMILWAGAAYAQQRPDLTRFKAFADPLVGTWDVTIKDREPNGKVGWEGRQKRVFAYTLADEFLEERALVQSKRLNREVLTGLHLLSYDPKRNLLIQQGFWPGQAGALFTFEAGLAEDNKSADGFISMPQEQGFRNRRRIEIKWQNPRELSLKTYGKDEAGREFLNEELIYRKVG